VSLAGAGEPLIATPAGAGAWLRGSSFCRQKPEILSITRTVAGNPSFRVSRLAEDHASRLSLFANTRPKCLFIANLPCCEVPDRRIAMAFYIASSGICSSPVVLFLCTRSNLELRTGGMAHEWTLVLEWPRQLPGDSDG
jgi:hypothetical protein